MISGTIKRWNQLLIEKGSQSDITQVRIKDPEELVEEFQKLTVIKNFKKLTNIYIKCCIYFEQDLGCCKDKSCLDGIINIQNFIFIPFFKKYDKKMMKYLNYNNYLKIAEIVQKETKNDLLHSPLWIQKYGKDFPSKKQIMKNESKWKQIRLEIILKIIMDIKSLPNQTMYVY